jgi:hypothetical protein
VLIRSNACATLVCCSNLFQLLQLDTIELVSDQAVAMVKQLAAQMRIDKVAALKILASAFTQAADTTTDTVAGTTANIGFKNTASGGAVAGVSSAPVAAAAVAPVVAVVNGNNSANNSNAAARVAVVPAPPMDVIDLVEVRCI